MNTNSNKDKLDKKRIPLWKRSPAFTIGSIIILCIFIIAFFPGIFTSINPTEINAKELLKAPSPQHLFGTDHLGRDVYARVIWGTRVDLAVGIFAMLIPFIVGTALGLISGYYGGKIDAILMRILDIFMAFSIYGLAIAIVAVIE